MEDDDDDYVDPLDEYFELTDKALKAAFKVHTYCGPGLLESAYQECLRFELQRSGFDVQTEVPMSLSCYGNVLDKAYIIDLLVDKTLVIELKSVENLQRVHRYQVKTYLRFGNFPIGLLLNFNTEHLKDGLMRVKNGHYRKPA